MACTERDISGLCCQPVPPGKLYQSGAGEELVQLSSEMVSLSITSNRSWLGCFLPRGCCGHIWRKKEGQEASGG